MAAKLRETRLVVTAKTERLRLTRDALSKTRDKLQRAQSALASERKSLQAARALAAAERARVQKVQGALEITRERLEASKTAIAVLKTKKQILSEQTLAYREVRRQLGLYRQGLLAEAAALSADELRADCYLALLPSSLPTAFELRRQFGGLVVCDCVENVEVDKHSLAPKWNPITLQMVNHLAHGSLAAADKLITVGGALAQTLERFGRPFFVLRNFRQFEEPAANDELRKACGLTVDDVLLLASGNVVVGFEPVLEALHALPEKFHLAALVRLKPESYEALIHQRIHDLGLQHRVHLLPFVPYDQLASTAAGADIGLITSDISNPNGAVALPNRCFDYLTAGLPVVAPAMPDVVELVEQHGFGRIVPDTSAEQWVRQIELVAGSLGEYRERALAARRLLTWESQEEALYDYLERPTSVTMIGFRDLTQYQRYLRLLRTLRKFGCTVKLAFFSLSPDRNALKEDASFYYTDNRYGVGKGLVHLVPAQEPGEVGVSSVANQ
ncbi:MAG: glycosyltransferase [Burkholderiaceae bacterium]|nr:glycosyltransferase [Burkholderiaceae bacterium]